MGKKKTKAKPQISAEEVAIRNEGKRLGIQNWHNKNIAGLKQEVLNAKAMEQRDRENPTETEETKTEEKPAEESKPAEKPAEEETKETEESTEDDSGIGEDEIIVSRDELAELKVKAKAHDDAEKEKENAKEEEKPEKVDSAPKAKNNEFEQSVKSEQEKGNKGFKEAAKEEALYPYPNQKGDRIGLWRRTRTDVDIKPYLKDTSYEFVRWADQQ